MRIVIAAVGRMKQGPERELAERFRKRAAASGRSAGLQDVDIVEIKESRAGETQRRMLEESIAIANIIPERAVTVILDERGESMDSASFAGRLQGWRSEDRPAVVFVVGGADGLATSLRAERATPARLRTGHLAAPAGANHAAGAALPGRHHPVRPPLPPGVSRARLQP